MNSSLIHHFRHGSSLILLAVLLLGLLLSGCGNWGWESIETDNESHLNIFGVISLDDSLESFVVVHRTLDTAGPDEVIAGRDTIHFETWSWWDEDRGIMVTDTFWYDPPWIRTNYESLYLVKDASVTISDGQNTYDFVRAPRDHGSVSYSEVDHWGEVIFDPAVYRNIDGTFDPQPETEYHLTIQTESGLSATGTTTTPARPQIYESSLADTLSMRQPYEVTWEHRGDYHTSLGTGQGGRYWEYWFCGLEQRGLMDPGDTTWVSSVDTDCFSDGGSDDAQAQLDIRLRHMDENYYRYFLSSDDDVEDISNFLIGEGSVG